MSATLITRKACVRCGETMNTPIKFLIECCKCQRVWHHPCHIPPISEAEILRRIEADEQSRFADGLGTWVCKRCSKQLASRKEVTSLSTHSTRPVIPDRPGLGDARQELITSNTQATRISQAETHHRGTPQIDLLHPPHTKRATKAAVRHRPEVSSTATRSTSVKADVARSDQLRSAASARNATATTQLQRRGSPSVSPDPQTERSSPTSFLTSSSAPSPPLSRSPSAITAPQSSHGSSRLSTPASDGTCQYTSSVPPSTSPSASPLPEIATSPTFRLSPPRIPYVMKGKEKMPDFRAISSNLREAGRLHGPPVLQEVLQHRDERSESDGETTPRPSLTRISERRDTHDIDDLYATPPPASLRSHGRYDTHDIDGMYATAEPEQRRHRADTHGADDMYAAPAPVRAPVRYDTHNIDDMYATPPPAPTPPTAASHRDVNTRNEGRLSQRSSEQEKPGLRLVFDWQDERFPGGKDDEIFMMLEDRKKRIDLRRGGAETRKPRKPGVTRRLGKRDRQRKEAEILSFYVAL